MVAGLFVCNLCSVNRTDVWEPLTWLAVVVLRMSLREEVEGQVAADDEIKLAAQVRRHCCRRSLRRI